jgi:N utilization substance protein B
MGRRRQSREYALQVLFQCDLNDDAPVDVLETFWSDQKASDEVRGFAETLVHGVIEQGETIDDRIRRASNRWKLERMAVVDRNVLRLGVYELAKEESPPAVVIDEAIEIAKRFGSEDSGKFIHAILDSVRAELAGLAAKPKNP